VNAGARLLRGSAGLSAARAATLVAQAAHFALIARIVDPGQFAGFVAATALVMIAGAVAEFGVVNTTVLALARSDGRERATLRTAVRANLLLLGTSTLLASLVSVVVLPHDASRTFVLLLPWTVCVGLQQPHIAYRRHRLEFGRLALADLLTRALPLLFAVPVQAAGPHWSDEARLAAVAAGLLAAAVAGTAVLRAGRVDRTEKVTLASAMALIRQAAPLGATTALSLVHTRVDQVILAGLGFRLALADYGVAYRPLDAALALAVAAGAAALPALSRADGTDRVRLARQQAALLGALALSMGAVCFALAPQLVAAVGGSRYRDAVPLARLLCPALVLSVLNMGVASVAIVQDRARSMLRIAAVGVVLNIALNLACDARYGPRAAALATVLSEAVGLVLMARLARASLPGSTPWRFLLGPLFGFVAASYGALAAARAVGPAAGAVVAVLAVGAGSAVLVAGVPRRRPPVLHRPASTDRPRVSIL
jgi:O-antigen/teichoic acid export membrane protein